MADTYGGYPQSAVNNAKRGIRLNEEVNNKCATDVGKQRARDIVAKRPFSLSVLKRVYSYLSRAKEYYNPSDDKACGTISYLLWGGESMRSWSERKLNQIEREEERQVSKEVKKGLENKVKDHNEEVKDLSLGWNAKVNYSKLVKVFERGIGAYKTNPQSVRPSVKSPEQWAYARVNSFLYAMKKGKFRSGKHDTDLLPNNHPVKEKMNEEKNNLIMKYKKVKRDLVATMITDDIEMPLYTTKEEAEQVAEEMGGSGSHEHTLDGEIVFMPFESHEEIMKIMNKDEEIKDEEEEDEEDGKMYDDEEEEVEDNKKKYKRNKIHVEGLERRNFLNSEIRIANTESREVVGYASVFVDSDGRAALSENLGGFREKIDPEAFNSVLENDVRALFNHDPNYILGRTTSGTLKLSVDKRGLKYSFTAPDTSYGRDLMVSLERGDISQSSFGFIVEEDSWDEDSEGATIRTIKKVGRLLDVSPVTYPAYPDAEVGKRSFLNYRTQKEKQENKKQEKDLIKRNLLYKKLKFIKLKNT
tara:strand:+ start:2348 stop:3934 length:1587 start_codon:yes stop_codon:yes gene_type:complete